MYRLSCPGLAVVLAVGAAFAAEPDARQLLEPPLTAADRAHWAFRPPVRPPVPVVRAAARVRTPVDAFILAELERAGLTFAPPADRATLLRRVTFDLTGLPPTPEEVRDFLADPHPDAYVRVVDRLLASPHYGEHAAQQWLDVVRYAESNGYEADGERPHAWRYRDYVVRAFNEDRPYDRFVREQLAGDQMCRGLDPRPNADLLVASGFNRCGPVHLVGGNTDPDVNRQEVLTEMTAGVGSAFLGLTVGCARCHNHKFDPFSQADYYRLQAFFAAAQPHETELATDAEKADRARRVAEIEARLAPLRKQVEHLEAPCRARLAEEKKRRLEPDYREALAVEPAKRTPQQKKLVEHAHVLLKITWDEVVDALTPEDRSRRAALRGEIHALEAQLPPPDAHAWTLRDAEKVPPTHLLLRGDPKRKGPELHPAFPRVLTAGEVPLSDQALDRVALAGWLTRPEHPLTARVLVNRLWQQHFTRGIVATPNDFGLRGARPTHPALLDWLACEFVARGWSVKAVHRLLVLSATYQQASQLPPGDRARAADPDNRLLGRMSRRRLTGEELRDSVLAVCAALNPEIGGPMVRVPLEPEVYDLIFTEGEPDGLWPVTPDPRQHARRSLYLFAKRNVRQPLFEAFDQPDTLTSCPVRPVSTFAPQALILLNGPFMQRQSKLLAARLLRECPADPDRQIERAYALALARPPREGELRMAREFLTGQADLLRERLRAGQRVELPPGLPEAADPATAAALADFCLALLNRNEFVYVR